MIEAMDEKSGKENPQPFDCGHCMKSFISPGDLSIHVKLKHCEKSTDPEVKNEARPQRKRRRGAKVLGDLFRPAPARRLIEARN